MVAYLFTCSLIIGVGEAMRGAKLRARQGRDTLRVTLAQHRRRRHHDRHRGPQSPT